MMHVYFCVAREHSGDLHLLFLVINTLLIQMLYYMMDYSVDSFS